MVIGHPPGAGNAMGSSKPKEAVASGPRLEHTRPGSFRMAGLGRDGPPPPEIIDRIYECAVLPEGWPALLGELADIAGARTGFWLIGRGRAYDFFAASTDIATEFPRPLQEGDRLSETERLRSGLAKEPAGFFRELDYYDETAPPADPLYRYILYPPELGWAAMTAIDLPTGDSFAISLERDRDRGPVSLSAIRELNELRPHLARTAVLSARLQLARVRITGQTLAAIALPALVLDGGGKVLAANDLIEAMTGYVRWRAFGRVSFNDRRAEKLLREAVETGRLETAPGILSFPVRDTDSASVSVAHLIPIRRSARDVFALCSVILILTPVALPDGPPVALIRSLFDLTAAEARVARALAAGQTVEAIAATRGVSLNTIRTHVRGVLEKTGFNRQAEVVALLNGIWSPRGTDRN
jgi:DNA-binding CsgD family transcriptional regulator